jgi:hypothetical protein
MFETPCSTLSLSIGVCSFVYEEPREAKPVVREEVEPMTVSALSERVDDVYAVSLHGIFGAESRRAVDDLYEVCGQAVKPAQWLDCKLMLGRLEERAAPASIFLRRSMEQARTSFPETCH